MTESNFGITQFVRGMAWHDAGKPFALGTARHTALGFWLLGLADYQGESLVALAHGHTSKRKTLSHYFLTGGNPLPGILLFCNLLDRLSASVYSFQSKGTEKHSEFHSFQNPFSRLQRSFLEWAAPINVQKDKLSQEVELPLWKDLQDKLPPQWRDTLENKEEIETSKSLSPPNPLPGGADALNVILRYMSHYPERTYPSVNDTSLTQHCRLSGIFAFVIYRNIEREDPNLLMTSITADNFNPIKNIPGTVRRHLTANLVRIAFEGYRSLYENAVRVDDLHGARRLTDLIRETFKETLAKELGIPDLANFLTISESQFDLVYLLPPADEPLADIIDRAYNLALARVAAKAIERLGRDFPQIAGQQAELQRQLSGLSCGLRTIPFSMPEFDNFDKFDEFAADYGQIILQAYQDSLEYVTFPRRSLPDEANLVREAEPIPPGQTCQVCGNHRVLTSPAGLNDVEKAQWQRYYEYAGHIFRENREQLCLSCVARRALSHGAVAKKMDEIVHKMFRQNQTRPNVWQAVPAGERDGPSLPPLLQPVVELTGEKGELIDRGAFYIRCRRKDGRLDCSELDIFPTTTYAADANGNVVLLALQPTKKSLFAIYGYDEAIEETEGRIDESLPEYRFWRETFVNFHDEVKQKKGDILAEPIRHVKPHLARVMERIAQIKTFYEALWNALIDKNICVLPLDLQYPTLRLLVPADRLDEVLQVLDQVITETLFSATYRWKKNEKGEVIEEADVETQKRLHGLLALLVPDLLHGVAILFKHKYPLYLALEAERDLFRQLEESEPDDDPDRRTRPNNGQWYGLRLAFSDLRGALSEVAPMLAEVTYAELGTVIDLAQTIDRRTIIGWANIINTIPPELKSNGALTRLADDLFTIRADRQGIKDNDVETLLAKNGKLFKPVHFIKMAIRE